MQIPDGPKVTVFIKKTDHLFLPFVPSLLPSRGFMGGISFLPCVSLSYVSLSF